MMVLHSLHGTRAVIYLDGGYIVCCSNCGARTDRNRRHATKVAAAEIAKAQSREPCHFCKKGQ